MAVNSMTVHVDVGASPADAFRIFTEEIDLWWVRGPVNFFDASRAVGMRLEPGVGGRILELYDAAANDARELGRITAWEPPTHLEWVSPDGVATRVSFSTLPSGSRVEVQATVPNGVPPHTDTYWLRVVPAWFGAWISRRDQSPHAPEEIGRLSVRLTYPEPRKAARWLADTFGLTLAGAYEDADLSDVWVEFRVGNAVLALTRGERGAGSSPVQIWVYVDDLEEHFRQTCAHNARIMQPIHQNGYRGYEAEDPWGVRWFFAQARPSMR